MSHPARDVGGDYYDFIELGNNRWGIAVGDVSGKGMPAALTMANLQASVRGFASTSTSAAQCVTAVNRLLCSSTNSKTFVTLFYAIYDSSQRTLTYCNAGHNPPFWFKADGTMKELEVEYRLGLYSEVDLAIAPKHIRGDLRAWFDDLGLR